MHERGWSFDRITFDPLSYLHAERMGQIVIRPVSMRERSLINAMLLQDLGLDALDRHRHAAHPWVRHWPLLPLVASLVGTWLMRPELACNGRLLHLPQALRRFSACAAAREGDGIDAHVCDGSVSRYMTGATSMDAPIAQQVQIAGLDRLLDWQAHAPKSLTGRLQLMFPLAMDSCFVRPRRPLGPPQQMLILQAVHYAKNYPNAV